MWSLRSCVIAVVVVAWSCGGGGGSRPGALSSRWTAPSILSHVPADSPYLVAVLEPVGEPVRRRMLQGTGARLAEALRALDQAREAPGAQLPPWARAASAILDELRGKDAATWLEQLGFDPRGRFVLYGLPVWPALRIELASPARLRSAIERALAAAGVHLPQRTLDGRAYWVAGDERYSLVAAVLEREAVAAVVPTASLPAALPLVLGTRAPEHSLAQTTIVADLLARHRFLGVLLAYLDSRRLIEVVAGTAPGPAGAPLRAAAGPVSPVCRADLDRLAAIAPRLVLGYRRLDDAGFEASAVLETAPGVIAALRRLHAVVPEVTSPVRGHPLFALGAAIDPDELVAWLQDVTRRLHDRPFACPWLDGINAAGGELAGELAAPLPPIWRGVRGFSMVIDDATLVPPGVAGHLLVAGDRVADLVSSLAGAIPAIAGIPLAPGARPIALPAQQLHLPVRSAHLALATDRLVIAAGEDSAQRATDHLASPLPRSSPLAVIAFDVPRLQQLLAALGQHPGQTLADLREVGIGLDLVGAGVTLDVWGTWAAAPAAIAAPP